MNKILKVRNVGDYSRWVGHTDRHPLVSVIDYAEVSPVRHSLNNYSIYGIFFHDEAVVGSTTTRKERSFASPPDKSAEKRTTANG